MHAVQQQLEAAHHAASLEAAHPAASGEWKYKQARDAGTLALFLVKGCDPDCTKAQLDYYHKRKPPSGPGVNENSALRTDPDAATRSAGELDEDQQAMVDQSIADSLGVGANTTS